MPANARFPSLAEAAAPPTAITPPRRHDALGLAAPIARRVAAVAVQMLVVAIVVFVVLRIIPADPLAMMLPPNATHEDVERIRHAFGFDRSIPEQFMVWLGYALHGDLGASIQSRIPVGQLILTALPTTVELVVFALIGGISLGFMLGILTFCARGTMLEQVGEMLASLAQAIPEFLWGILLILLFGLWLHALPFIGPIDSHMVVQPKTGFLLIDTIWAGRWDAFGSHLSHLILPTIAIAMIKLPLIMRLLRSSLIEVYTEEYIDAARLRGVGETRILFGHALRNAAMPTVTLISVQAAQAFGGSLLIESIYGLPGLGNLMIGAIRTHDLPLIQGITLTYCAVVLLINGVIDVIYLWLNPRLRAR
jgi:ABC-type dipeptide/oligopeptide/nickel transport system permease component